MKKKFFIRDVHHKIGDSLPSSSSFFFQCLKCWVIIESNPSVNKKCGCGNVSIDVDYSRAGARDENLLRVLEIYAE